MAVSLATPGDFYRRLKRGVRQRPGCRLLDGDLVRMLYLGENLRFADHHAVQAAGHQKEVADGLPIGPFERMREDLARIQAVDASEKVGDLLPRWRHPVCRRCVQFHPVAGGKEHGLSPRERPSQAIQGKARLVGAERQPLTNLQSRLVMATAENLHPHDGSSQDREIEGIPS